MDTELIKNKNITIGYNLTGQEFFDTILCKRRYIKEFFFALTHTMPNMPLNIDMVYNSLKDINMYGIPGNLLLNNKYSQENYDKLIRLAETIVEVRSITVSDYDLAKRIKSEYRDKEIHISTHGSQLLDINDIDNNIVSVVNINEPYFYEQKSLINKCKQENIKIKIIANRRCIPGKANNIAKLFNVETAKCCNGICSNLYSKYKWIDLARCFMYKEFVDIYNPDYIKISTRECNNDEVRQLLNYWTSDDRTRSIGDVKISDDKYDIYKSWIKDKWELCCGDCIRCGVCSEYYKKLQN